MGKITSIEEQKGNKKRFNVYIDGDFAFKVHEDVVVWHKLAVGKELSDTFIDEVILAEEQSKANNHALKLLGYRAQSEYEIRNKLSQKGYESNTIEGTILYLKRNGLIDDYAFAKSLVNDELNIKLSGYRLIKQKLLQKGISKEICQRILEETIDEEDALSACIMLAEKKLNTICRNDDKADKIRKVGAFLQRKGYSYDMVQQAINRLFSED